MTKARSVASPIATRCSRMRLSSLFALLALSVAPSSRGQAAADCVPINQAILSQPDHTVFARIFEAASIGLNATDPYTIFVPEDGNPVADDSGANGIVGLFSDYQVNTTTVESIRASKFFSQVQGFVSYYVVRGTYTQDDLLSRSPSNHLRTLFNTSSDTCVNPGTVPAEKNSDGDLKFDTDNAGKLVIVDDSTNTVTVTVTKADIPACNGSIVHLIKGVLNPCCNIPGEDCSSADLDPKQLNVELSASPSTEPGVGGSQSQEIPEQGTAPSASGVGSMLRLPVAGAALLVTFGAAALA